MEVLKTQLPDLLVRKMFQNILLRSAQVPILVQTETTETFYKEERPVKKTEAYCTERGCHHWRKCHEKLLGSLPQA